MRTRLGALLLVGALVACGGAPPAITTCESERGIRPICGFQNPEDLRVLDDGTLLVSQMGTMDGSISGSLAHFDPTSGQLNDGIESGSCPLSFAIVAIDPDTLATETIFENTGPPMGAATVAVQRGDELYMGTFAGDRIIVTSF